MASVIKAGNATDGVQVTSDNTGILELKTGTGAGTTAVTVDASQNAGLGVTPSAWGSTFKALELNGGSLSSGASTNLVMMQNAYYDGVNYIYKTTSTASRYWQVGGAHVWFNAASGTAGNAISFTQAMTLDASGNLGLGTSSPTNFGAGFTVGQINGSSGGYLLVSQAGTTSIGEFGTESGLVYVGSRSTNTPIVFRQNGTTERVRIDASGFTQFSSNLVMPYQGAPTSKAAAATLSGAELITGILNTTGTTYTITLPTGTNIEGALTWAGNNVSLDWTVINTASGTITIGANGNTTLGSLTIATGTSAGFRIRRTAANTFTVYRMR